jgi:hypothetical protein
MAPTVSRSAFQGVWTVLRFNWHLHALWIARDVRGNCQEETIGSMVHQSSTSTTQPKENPIEERVRGVVLRDLSWWSAGPFVTPLP